MNDWTKTPPTEPGLELMPRSNNDWFKRAYPDSIDSLKKYLRRIVGSSEVAEDLAHDAFVRVFTASNFEQIKSPERYLFRTARNLALDRKSLHCVARTDIVEEVADIADERASVEREVMTTEEFEVLCKAITRLPERRQEILILRLFFEFSCQEIADQRQISRTTVHRELARAIRKLRLSNEEWIVRGDMS